MTPFVFSEHLKKNMDCEFSQKKYLIYSYYWCENLKHFFFILKKIHIYMKRISYLVIQLLLEFFNIFHDFDQRLPFINSQCNTRTKFIRFLQMKVKEIIMSFFFIFIHWPVVFAKYIIVIVKIQDIMCGCVFIPYMSCVMNINYS